MAVRTRRGRVRRAPGKRRAEGLVASRLALKFGLEFGLKFGLKVGSQVWPRVRSPGWPQGWPSRYTRPPKRRPRQNYSVGSRNVRPRGALGTPSEGRGDRRPDGKTPAVSYGHAMMGAASLDVDECHIGHRGERSTLRASMRQCARAGCSGHRERLQVWAVHSGVTRGVGPMQTGGGVVSPGHGTVLMGCLDPACPVARPVCSCMVKSQVGDSRGDANCIAAGLMRHGILWSMVLRTVI